MDNGTKFLRGRRIYRRLLHVKKFSQTDAAASEEIISRHLLGLGTAKDVAGMILFLLSERASWITGQNFFADGGYIVGSYT